MTRDTNDIFICDYCGFKHTDELFMKIHEDCCSENPNNHPCIKCENCEIGLMGEATCKFDMDMDSIGGKVLCIKYKKRMI